MQSAYTSIRKTAIPSKINGQRIGTDSSQKKK